MVAHDEDTAAARAAAATAAAGVGFAGVRDPVVSKRSTAALAFEGIGSPSIRRCSRAAASYAPRPISVSTAVMGTGWFSRSTRSSQRDVSMELSRANTAFPMRPDC